MIRRLYCRVVNWWRWRTYKAPPPPPPLPYRGVIEIQGTINGHRIEGTANLEGKLPGVYDLRVMLPDGESADISVTLPDQEAKKP